MAWVDGSDKLASANQNAAIFSRSRYLKGVNKQRRRPAQSCWNLRMAVSSACD